MTPCAAGTDEQLTASSIAALVSGRLDGPGEIVITRPASMEESTEGDITLMTNAAYAANWASCGASAAFVSSSVDVPDHDSTARALIIVDDAQQAMVTLLELVAPPISSPAAGVHSTAVISPTATLGTDVCIGAWATVGDRTRVHDGAILHEGVRVGADVTIGRGTRLHENVVIGDRSTLGADCRIHPGAVIGDDGFGYLLDESRGALRKIPQIGNVVMDDEVEVGANTTIDRGKYGATRVGFGTKIDNLVQVGHNVSIGRHCVIAAGAALGGSSTIGDGTMLGGQVGISDHITVGAGSRIGGQSGVIKDVPPGASLFGTPAQNATGMLKGLMAIPKLPELLRQIGRSPRP